MVINEFSWKFRWLLITLFGVILIIPPAAELLEVELGFVSMLMITLSVLWAVGKRGLRILGLPILLSLGLIFFCVFRSGSIFDGFQFIAMALVIIGAIWITVDYLKKPKCVDIEVLSAALAIYLLMGIGFGCIYAATGTWISNGLVVSNDVGSELINLDNYIYFSFAVLTTLGFGDIYPGDSLHRSLVVVESVLGVFYLAIVIAKMVATYHKESDT